MSQVKTKFIFKKLLMRDVKVIILKQKVLAEIRATKTLKAGTWWSIF